MTTTNDTTGLPAPGSIGYTIAVGIEGVQIFRDTAGQAYQHGFQVKCRCGYRTRIFATIEMAELMREQHEADCLWPKL